MLNQSDYRSIDQSTPERDNTLFNNTGYDKGFGEAFLDAAKATTKENIYHFASVIAPLSKMGLVPEVPKSWGPNISANELNKKYNTDIFKDDMPDYQANVLKTMRDLRDRDQQRSSLYGGGTFLGQNAPQWFGGFAGSAISNPINILPYGMAARGLGTVGQGVLSNVTGAVLDWSFRKSIESRTGDEVTAAQLLTDIVAGTVVGAAVDVGINKMTGRRAFDLGKSPEEMFNLKFDEDLKTPKRRQGFKEWVEGQHAEYLQRRAAVIDEVAIEHAKIGLPVDTEAIAKTIDPYPMKVDVVELTHPDGTKQRTLVPRELDDVNFQDYGMKKPHLEDDVVYRVAGDEVDTLERANALAKATNSDVEVVPRDGAPYKMKPIDVEKEIMKQREALRVQKMNLPSDVAIQVDGIDFDDLGKAAVFAKASNSKVTLIEPDGTSWKIDPPMEFRPIDPLSDTQGGRPQFGDPSAIKDLEARVADPDNRILIDKEAVKAFEDFEPDTVKAKELSELEQDIAFMTEGIDAEVKAKGLDAPDDMIKHLEAINEIDKTAEVEDNVFKAITSCILRSL